MSTVLTTTSVDEHPSPTGPLAVNFTPIRMLEVELSRPLPAILGLDEATGRRYRRALALVRLHTHPLGLVELELGEHGLGAGEYAAAIWRALGADITTHLRTDGLPEVTALDASGLPHDEERPVCLRERERFLEIAPFVSVIILTNERADRLATCLHSLLASDYPDFEIIVVDSVPKTTTTADLYQREYADSPRVRYIREDRSGSAAARNRGLAIARGDIVAFTDDDVIVDRYWLAEMIKGFTVADDVACVTGLILPMEIETPAQLWFEQYGGFSKGFARRVYDLEENRSDNPIYPYNMGGFGSGNSMAFDRRILRGLGNFDPTLGNGTPALGGVDVEAFLRVVVNGHKLVYEPAAIVHHLHRRDYAALRRQVYYYGVGMTAILTRTVLHRPSLLLDLARKVPAGVRYALNPRSDLNNKKGTDYPAELTQLDHKGMVYGPLAYLRSWWWWHISLPLGRRQLGRRRR